MKRRICFNSPVSLTLALACLIVTVLILYLPENLKNGFEMLFSAPASQGSGNAFNFKNPVDYLRLFLYPLAQVSMQTFLCNVTIILLLGARMEERFGKFFLILMFATSVFVSGIMNVCFLKVPLQGAESIVFLLLILFLLEGISKSEILLTPVVLLAFVFSAEIIDLVATRNLGIIAKIVGAVTGSLFSFLVAPKNRKSTKITTKSTSFFSKMKKNSKKNAEYEEDLNAPESENASDNAKNNSDDSEYVGTISL